MSPNEKVESVYQMSKLQHLYGDGRFSISFEAFAPKTEDGMNDLFANLTDLNRFGPAYMTCTYGAGGSTREKTLRIVGRMKKQFQLPVAAHLTCVGSTVADLLSFLHDAEQLGVDYIVALRGDPPKGQSAFQVVEGGLRYAGELVALIRQHYGDRFGIAVAGYPEKHIEASSMDADLDNLKRKVDAGADVVISQLFYINDDFYRFRDLCAARGIDVPIVPGILPITSLHTIKRITSMCGARLPKGLLEKLEAHADDPQGQFDVGVYHATRQVEDLTEQGAPGVHFYVLNKSHATGQLLRALTLPHRMNPVGREQREGV